MTITMLNRRRKIPAKNLKEKTPNPVGFNQHDTPRSLRMQVGVRLPQDLIQAMDDSHYTRTQLVETALERLLRNKNEELKIDPHLLLKAITKTDPSLEKTLTLETIVNALKLLVK